MCVCHHTTTILLCVAAWLGRVCLCVCRVAAFLNKTINQGALLDVDGCVAYIYMNCVCVSPTATIALLIDVFFKFCCCSCSSAAATREAFWVWAVYMFVWMFIITIYFMWNCECLVFFCVPAHNKKNISIRIVWRLRIFSKIHKSSWNTNILRFHMHKQRDNNGQIGMM